MKAEASGTDLLERAAFERCWFNGHAFIGQENFDSTVGGVLTTKLQLAAAHLDGETRAAAVSVAHDVGESFINGANDGAGVGFAKVQDFGGTFNSGANEAQRFRIA